MTFWHAMQCLPLTNWIVFYPIKGRATGTLANPYSPTTADRVTYTVYAADCMRLFHREQMHHSYQSVHIS